MAWPPAVSDFKAQFVREFVYGPGFDTVQDADIQQGLNEAAMDFNTAIWVNAAEQQIAYLYAAAHFMVLKVQGAGGLMANNRGRGIDNHGGGAIDSKSVGNVSVSYATPDFVRQSPILTQFMETSFGRKFIALMTPRLVGNVAVVSGSPFQGGFGGNVPTLVITTQSLPAGTHSVPYSAQLLAIGGLLPITWSKQTGTLPTGLTLSPAGILSGTPSAPGTYTFRVVAVDRQQTAAGMNYTVVIA